ncbi:unnamed protein product [Calicophoron daubneyi]|uniref:RRM domain-containing protein n=1 Tax=Calicophoron daubneyi TaxID=300641 RepID=A0AAV2TSQ4_CALDB
MEKVSECLSSGNQSSSPSPRQTSTKSTPKKLSHDSRATTKQHSEEQDSSLKDSPPNSSSTDSGRSSISSSQASNCEDVVDHSAKSPNGCRYDETSVISVKSNSQSQSSDGGTNEEKPETLENFDIYADVTLIPKTSETITVSVRPYKPSVKRVSRAKLTKTSKAHRHQGPQQQTSPTKHKGVAAWSSALSTRTILKQRKNEGITREQDESSVEQHPSKQANGVVSNSSLQSPDVNNKIPVMLKKADRSSALVVEQHSRKTSPFHCSITCTENETKGSLIYPKTFSSSSGDLSVHKEHTNKSTLIPNPEPMEPLTAKYERESSTNLLSKSNRDLPSKISSNAASPTRNEASPIRSNLHERQPSAECGRHEQDDADTRKITILPDNSRSTRPESFTFHRDSENQSINTNLDNISAEETRSSELKVSSYSTSSSPVPTTNNTLQNSANARRRTRPGGSPVSSMYTHSNKSSILRKPPRSMLVRPLLISDYQSASNQSLGLLFKKNFTDRQRRSAAPNPALLPNPVVPNPQCINLQSLDSSNLLINQPLCWWLPGVNLNNFATSYTELGGKVPQLMRNEDALLLSSTMQASPQSVCSDSTLTRNLSSLQMTGNDGRYKQGASFTEHREYHRPFHQKQPSSVSLEESHPSTLTTQECAESLESVSTEPVTGNLAKTSSSQHITERGVTDADSRAMETMNSDKLSSSIAAATPPATTTTNNVRKAIDNTQNTLSTGQTCVQDKLDLNGAQTNWQREAKGMGCWSTISEPVSNGQVGFINPVDSYLMQPNFLYFYNPEGHLFAVPASALMYQAHSNPNLAEAGSTSDSAYSSPQAVLNAQTLSEGNVRAVYGAQNFEVSNNLISVPDYGLARPNGTAQFYEQPSAPAQVNFPTAIQPLYVNDMTQWPTGMIPVENQSSQTLESASMPQQSPFRPVFVGPSSTMLIPTSYQLGAQALGLTKSQFAQRYANLVPNLIEKSLRNQKRDESDQLGTGIVGFSQQNISGKPNETGKFGKNVSESSGILGNAKPSPALGLAYSSPSLLGDKQKTFNSNPFASDEFSRNNSAAQANAARQKKHSSKTNLYIRGLPPTFTEEQLHTLAPERDLIRSVKLIAGSEGEMYGFIDFTSNAAAKAALLHIKSTNRDLYVNFAYESEKDPQNVYITNIPETWTASNVEDLKKIFQPYGQISTAIVMTKRSNNFCTGAGFVRFNRAEDAQRAIEGIRSTQVVLEGGKGPLEVKLADRQKPSDDQSSQGKSRSPKSVTDSIHRTVGEVNSERHLGTYRTQINPTTRKNATCLLPSESSTPLLGNGIGTVGPVRPSGVTFSSSLLANPTTLNAYNFTNRLAPSNTFAFALQAALNSAPLVNSNLLLQNPLGSINLQLPIQADSPGQTGLLSYPPTASQVTSLIPNTRNSRVATGLLQNPAPATPGLFTSPTGMIPIVRTMDDLNFSPGSINFSGTHQPPMLSHDVIEPVNRIYAGLTDESDKDLAFKLTEFILYALLLRSFESLKTHSNHYGFVIEFVKTLSWRMDEEVYRYPVRRFIIPIFTYVPRGCKRQWKRRYTIRLYLRVPEWVYLGSGTWDTLRV